MMKNVNLLGSGVSVPNDTWTKPLLAQLSSILFYIFAVISALVILYCIYLGFLLAKAKDGGERSKAKNRIHHAFAGLIAIVLLTTVLFSAGFTQALFSNIQGSNTYRFSETLFQLSDVSGGKSKTITLYQDNSPLTSGVTFSGSATNIAITGAGVLTATAAGTISVSASVNGQAKLTETLTVTDSNNNNGGGGNPDPNPTLEPGPDNPNLTAKDSTFQNPVNYTNLTPTDPTKEYGSGNAPYVSTDGSWGSMMPADTAFSIGVKRADTDFSIGTTAAGDPAQGNGSADNPFVFFQAFPGIVFTNQGSTGANSRDIYASRLGVVTKVVSNFSNTDTGKVNGWGNYIIVAHYVGNDYGSVLNSQWLTTLVSSKIVTPTSGSNKVVYSRYCNLAQNSIKVEVGDVVGGKQGEKLPTASGLSVADFWKTLKDSDGKAITVKNNGVTLFPYGKAMAQMGTTGYTLTGTPQMYYEQFIPGVDESSALVSAILGPKLFDIYINPHNDQEIFYISQNDIKNAQTAAKAAGKNFTSTQLNFQVFDGGKTALSNVKGYNDLFSTDIQNTLKALGDGDLTKLFGLKNILTPNLSADLNKLSSTELNKLFGSQSSGVMSSLQTGNIGSIVNTTFSNDFKNLMNMNVSGFVNPTLSTTLMGLATNPSVSPTTQNNLNSLLNGNIESMLNGAINSEINQLKSAAAGELSSLLGTSQADFNKLLNVNLSGMFGTDFKGSTVTSTAANNNLTTNLESIFKDPTKLFTGDVSSSVTNIKNGNFSGLFNTNVTNSLNAISTGNIESLFSTPNSTIKTSAVGLNTSGFSTLLTPSASGVFTGINNLNFSDVLNGKGTSVNNLFTTDFAKGYTELQKAFGGNALTNTKAELTKLGSAEINVYSLLSGGVSTNIFNTDITSMLKVGSITFPSLSNDVKQVYATAAGLYNVYENGIFDSSKINWTDVQASIASGLNLFGAKNWTNWKTAQDLAATRKKTPSVQDALAKALQSSLNGVSSSITKAVNDEITKIANDATLKTNFTNCDTKIGNMATTIGNQLSNTMFGTNGTGGLLQTLTNQAKQFNGTAMTMMINDGLNTNDIMTQVFVDIIQAYYSVAASQQSTIVLLPGENGEPDQILVDVLGGVIDSFVNSDNVTDEDQLNDEQLLDTDQMANQQIQDKDADELKRIIAVLLTEAKPNISNDSFDKFCTDNNFVCGDDGAVYSITTTTDTETGEQITEETLAFEDVSAFLAAKPAGNTKTYETLINEENDADYKAFLAEMESKVTDNNGYTDLTGVGEGMTIEQIEARLQSITNLVELKETTVYLVNYVYGAAHTEEITKDTRIGMHAPWYKTLLKPFAALFTAVIKIALPVIRVVAALANSVKLGITMVASKLAHLSLDVKSNLKWGTDAVKAMVNNITTAGKDPQIDLVKIMDLFMPDKVELGKKGDPTIEQEVNKGTADADNVQWTPTQSMQKELIYYFNKLGDERATEVIETSTQKAVEEAISNNAKMLDTLNANVEQQCQKLETDAMNAIGMKTVTDLQTTLRSQFQTFENDLTAITNKIESDLKTAVPDIETKIGQNLKNLWPQIIRQTEEDLICVALQSLTDALSINVSGLFSLVFKPDPISGHYYYNHGVQIDIKEIIKCFLGIGDWNKTINGVVQNQPYLKSLAKVAS